MVERTAVIGAGIAGLAAARRLSAAPGQRVTLFEAATHFGGHAHTVDVTLDGVTHGVDTGFLVFNRRTYPGLLRLFDELAVPVAESDMSFSVQAHADALEWSGSSLRGVFAQARNLGRPAFWAMLADIARFNRLGTALAQRDDVAAATQTVGDFLAAHRFSRAFRDWYLLPMISCIWSCPQRQMLDFPFATLARFCHNHGLLQVADRPQWYTVRGGSRQYVRRIVAGLADARAGTPVLGVQRHAAGVRVRTADSAEHFDNVVFACHSEQALQLLGDDADADERALLGAVRYHANRAVLHTDASVLPARRAAWAAWNFESAAPRGAGDAQVCLHYLINCLQPLPWRQPVLVSLNPLREPAQVLGAWDYAHPVFDAAAVAAQRELPRIQGRRNSWYCGAWTGYGFHEDGLQSGFAAAESVLRRPRGGELQGDAA